MTKQTISSLLSIVAVSALTIGCGSSSATTKTTTGTVIDDYISGATVCVDVNNDGKRDAGDTPCTTTNSTGQFTFASDVSASPLVMSGGTDVGTGDPFTGTFTAPAGSSVVNPLTTIVQALVTTGNGRTVAEAQAIVKTSLGLPAAIDLTTYDPIAALESTVASDVEAAKTVFAQQSSIQAILTTVATTIAATVTGTDEDDVTDAAANQIAAIMLATPVAAVVDVADSANVATIITATATATSTTVDATLVTAVAAQVDATSDQVIADIAATTGTGDIRQAAAQVAEVTQDNASAISTALIAGTAVATIVASTTTARNTLATDVGAAAANVTASTALETVATEDSAPAATETTVTGATGGN